MAKLRCIFPLVIFCTAVIFGIHAAGQSPQQAIETGLQVFALRSSQYDSFQHVPELLREDWQTHSVVRWDIAKPLSAISYQVYEEETIITRYFLSSMGFELVEEVPYKTMYGYIASVDDVMVIAFRGTNLTSIRDWHVNWQYKQKPFLGHWFHEGFVDHYLGMEPKIRQAIQARKPRHIWITGHSLGGALAVVAAAHLKTTLGVEPRLCTFGQPRVTDSAGAAWLDSQFSNRYARFVNGSDIVPSLPPTYPRIRTYGHAGDFHAFGANELTIADSLMTLPPATTEYCGTCGRSKLLGQTSPVYQSSEEVPPLSKAEYDQLLANENGQIIRRNDGTTSYKIKAGMFDYFADHKMGKYVKQTHSYGSKEHAMAIPGR